jgi:putative transposase
MRHNKSEVYLHIVWTTEGRQPLLGGDCERSVHRCIESEAAQLGCAVLALNGMPDHIHLVLRLPTRISIAVLVKQVKGVSSSLVNSMEGYARCFRWKEGYGVFSISRPYLNKVISYVQNQKRHHADQRVWEDWEEPNQDHL